MLTRRRRILEIETETPLDLFNKGKASIMSSPRYINSIVEKGYLSWLYEGRNVKKGKMENIRKERT